MTNSLSLSNLGGRQTGETLYDFLERRERELENIAIALRGELGTVEHELAHVQSAKRQIGNLPSFGRTPLGANLLPVAPLPADTIPGASALFQSTTASNPPTIKDMILKALWTGFRDTGATQAQLRQFISDAYGRDIDRTSMSPQISRLRQDGLLKQKGGEDNWRLTAPAIELLRRERWYGAETD